MVAGIKCKFIMICVSVYFLYCVVHRLAFMSGASPCLATAEQQCVLFVLLYQSLSIEWETRYTILTVE